MLLYVIFSAPNRYFTKTFYFFDCNLANKATNACGVEFLEQTKMQRFLRSAQIAPCTAHYDHRIYSYCICPLVLIIVNFPEDNG